MSACATSPSRRHSFATTAGSAAAESQKFQETHAVAASVLSDADTAILECNTCFELLQAGAEVTVGDKAAVSTSAAGAGEEGDGEGKEEEAGWGEEDGEDGEGGEEWEEVELSASSFSAVAFLASLEKSGG